MILIKTILFNGIYIKLPLAYAKIKIHRYTLLH